MKSLSLNLCIPHKYYAIINRLYALLHFTALIALVYYRLSSFSLSKHTLPYLLIFASELLLSLIWLFDQAYRWRPVSRATFPERLPDDKELPAIDIFICTADPKKEPPVEVMNTVLSAMALDYPPEKLCVYLSDDGGSSLTLNAMREAWMFARSWLPFCRRFGIKTRCPKVYFSGSEDDDYGVPKSVEYEEAKDKIKRKYELFKDLVKNAEINGESEEARTTSGKDHPPLVEVIPDSSHNEVDIQQVGMPLLVYVSREKRPSHPHHFKAGALNVLTRWPGMDGLQGPMLSGTGFYMKREALYGNLSHKDLLQLKQSFGHSNEFIVSVQQRSQRNIIDNRDSVSILVEEAQFLATCTYEKHTLWGDQVGFLYDSVVEDYFTGFMLHCKGWTSVLCNPTRPAFLGSTTSNLNDTLVQGTRWNSGLFEVTISRFCPFIYGLSRMSLLQTMCYGYFSLQPVYSLPLWCLATLPQLCLFNGIPMYPKVSTSCFIVYSFIFIASFLKHLQEVLSTGGSILNWWNEQRIWMIKSVTQYTYGCSDAVLKFVGIREASFLPTNKVVDDEQVALYQMGKFNFQMSRMLLTPIVTLVILNMISLTGGVARMFNVGNWNEMFGQVFLSLYILVVNYPVIEGMVLRKDKGRVPFSVSLLSLLLSLTFLFLGSIALY